MQNSRRSLTLKVVAGYLIVAIVAGFSVYFIYQQVVSYSEIAESNAENNQQLILLSEITADLNKSENTSRRLIQAGNDEDLSIYDAQIDTIKEKLDQLKSIYPNFDLEAETDSIAQLLEQKKENLKDLDSLRATESNTNYYAKVLKELKSIDQSFQDYNYENRFRNLKPYQRDVLIKLLEYSREDNAEQLTNQRLDSIVQSVRKVLIELEYANRQFLSKVNDKETELLNNDMILNQRLRNILTGMEIKERENSMERSQIFQSMLRETSNNIIIGGIIIAVIILFFIINIVGDITKSQQYRMQLEESKSFAESLLASREQFMAAITHDLRSPLTTVMGYTDLIQKTGLDEKQSHYIRQVKKSSEFILRLVNDLLDLSKLEAGKMLVESLPFNPKKLVEDTVHNIIPAEKKKEVKIRIDTPPEVNVQVKSDPFRIKQILANLISNAWKFTEEGSIVISAELQQLREDDHILQFRVKDSGIGISEAMQEAIFEEFSQENSSIEKRFGGSGLGLAITKRLTELLQGKISLKSKQGEGSEFIIEIPVVKIGELEDSSEEMEETEEIPEIQSSGKTALIVDDEPGQLSLTVELARSMGLEIETAVNGKIALQKLTEKMYDIILTDIQMPVKDGFELIKAIRDNNDWQDIPVIALSGRTDVEDEIYADAGFDDNLLKPYKPANLKAAIAELLELDQQDQEAIDGDTDKFRFKNYDLSEIYEFSGNDEEAMNTIIQAFLEGAASSLKELEDAYRNEDSEETAKIAHRMLPMLRQMKAVSITPSLLKLEKRESIPEEEFESLKTNLSNLMQDLESVTV
ncbi:MAG: ATP-binding protein [Christiangramia sp.]|nr:hybrid sensor histidine kinase/response regulator [Christiangramia sp.]